MSITSIIILATIAVCTVYFIVLYNGLVGLKHGASKHFANIDVLLKQRHDELPKRVDACKQYMNYESETLERVIMARSLVASAQTRKDMKALGRAESKLRSGLGQLFALAENYPELKANESFQQLQKRITELENTIADRREVYNEAVNNNNVRIEQIPDIVVARLFNFGSFELLEFHETMTRDIDIKALFSGA